MRRERGRGRGIEVKGGIVGEVDDIVIENGWRRRERVGGGRYKRNLGRIGEGPF